MKILDVSPFHDGLQRNVNMLTRIEGKMKAIQTATLGLASMEDSLKGTGGNAIRAFYNDCHLPFLQFFFTFKTAFDSTLTQMGAELDALEPDRNGFIRQSFLEGEVEEGLTEISQVTSNLTDETNGIMDQVSDIVALPHLDDSGVQDGVSNARKKRDNTVTDLNEFDSTQTNALMQIESDLLTLELWLLEVEGMMNDGLTDIDFPADRWGEYSESHPLQTQLDTRLGDTETVDAEGEKEVTGEVSSANPTVMMLKDAVGNAKRVTTGLTGGISAFGMYVAGKDGGITTSRVFDPKTGKYSYRINATGNALKNLRVDLGSKAFKELMKNVPKGNRKWSPKHYEIAANNKVTLKYGTKKPGLSGWSGTGDEALKKHPSLAYYNDQATNMQKAKTVGSATLKGTGKSFTDLVDVKGMVTKGPLNGISKGLGPIGAGLSYYGNYTTAKDAGLSDGEAAGRATVDTAIDVAVGGAVQAGFTATFTVAIPIPGVGTAVGVGLGILANVALNTKFGEEDKSVMDHVKGWFH
ncbi:ribonuclease YeeF family protein [Psychrobacillus sp. OK032]|uniref:ribonuclease YeeF family protein n=1 Tax=Psychrobacillus sp. OK032 TaxID=1884358 RepID=UPI0008B5F81E|nr:LXG domain-containing protein [Psychrobacillus sp. OK032]SER67436.1 LXG domain of WXG superfamily protein [Psychrobacillus sp. OK032]